MSNENERPANSWEDEDEEGTTFRDSYLRAVNQNRPPSHSGDEPRQTPETRTSRQRPRGVPGSADYYEEIEEDAPPARQRPKRQSREEVEARLRQRPRQPIYSRDQEEPRTRSAQQAPRPTRRMPEEDDYPYQKPMQARPTREFSVRPPARRPADAYEEYDEYEIIEQGRRQPQRRRRRGKRVFSTLLTGCLGGAITLLIVAAVLAFLLIHNTPLGQNLGITKATYKQASQQALEIGAVSQLIVKNQAGNISVSIDPNANSASLSSVKHVQADSQSAANTQFKQIVLTTSTIARGADSACLVASCLLVNATTPTPATGGGLFGGSNGDSIDLTIVLPTSFNSFDPKSPNIISANDNAGNISVSSFNGMLDLSGNVSNITVTHTLIFAGTCLQTLHGNITVNQASIFDLASPSKLIPCNNTTSNDPNHPWFSVKSGVGNVEITLTTNLSNLLLDANTNRGTITDDFNLAISNNDDSATYHGPLVPNTTPKASLYVAASTGNIVLHKQ